MPDALVLGGGGVGGIAWSTGVLAGLADAGRDVTGAELIVGTSAGANVAAQLASGLSLEELYERQVEPRLQSAEITVDVDLVSWVAEISALTQASTVLQMRRAVRRFAIETLTVSERVRRAVIESRLPSLEWPMRALKIVAVDAESGEPRVFETASGVSLLDAVTASSAIPGVWPPATIGGRRYIDGGVRSGANADYAAGASRALVIMPLGAAELFPTDKPLAEMLDELRASGCEVALIEPDEASRAAIGANPLDPSTRAPAAKAGRAQGHGLEIEIEWGVSNEPALRFLACAIDQPPAAGLVQRMRDEMSEIYDGLDIDNSHMPKAGAAELGPPDGIFLVGLLGDSPACCGGVKRLPDGSCEIKRMFVMPDARHQGVARALLQELERRALDLGYVIVRLDTGPRQDCAQRMYERAGYQPVVNFNANPIASFFGEKLLLPGSS